MNRFLILGVMLLTGMLYTCSSNDSGKDLPLYFTDTPGDQFPSVEVTVHEVNLCSDHDCMNKVPFDTGIVTVDLAGLNGILQYITTTGIPLGTYNRLEVVLDRAATITDDADQEHTAYFSSVISNPNQPNEVQCPSDLVGQCTIKFNGTVQPFAMGELIIDFVLKEFEVEETPCSDVTTDPDSWCITEVKMKPLTPAEVADGLLFKIVGTVVSESDTSITVRTDTGDYTVNLTESTVCEIDDGEVVGVSDCLSGLEPEMCLEITTPDDPAETMTLTAGELEAEDLSDCAGDDEGPDDEGPDDEGSDDEGPDDLGLEDDDDAGESST
jgi:hypothetical protein